MDKVKVCFLTVRNIFDTPCLPKYSSLLNNNFDIIYFDRYGVDENCSARHQYKFRWILDLKENSRIKKYFGYILFRRYAKKIIKKNKYEKIILLPTQTAFLFYDFLLSNYKKQYILDIRDYASENNPIVYNLGKKLIKNSAITSITSPAYTQFLPKHNYLISHNVQQIDTKLVEKYRNRKYDHDKKIVISFIGTIRFIDQLHKIIRIFNNDNRFELLFIGSGSELLKEYCNKLGTTNVQLIGRFKREEMADFYMKTDIVMNVYGNNDPYLDYALSNKLYSAAIIGMPILVSPDTYMHEITKEYGFGLAVDLDDKNVPDLVFDYYKSINWDDLFAGCDKFMKKVEIDEQRYMSTMTNFLG